MNPRDRTLMDLLPFTALVWLGVIAAAGNGGITRARVTTFHDDPAG